MRRPRIGFFKGEFTFPDDFDAMDAEIERMFYDGLIEPEGS